MDCSVFKGVVVEVDDSKYVNVALKYNKQAYGSIGDLDLSYERIIIQKVQLRLWLSNLALHLSQNIPSEI